MKTSLLTLFTFCSFFIFAQSSTPNTSPNAGLKLGKNHPHNSNPDYIAKTGKMMFNFADKGYTNLIGSYHSKILKEQKDLPIKLVKMDLQNQNRRY